MTDGLTLDELLGRLARDELPWDKAWVADFGDFDARFTLHDSNWVGVFLAVCGGNEAVLILEWDAPSMRGTEFVRRLRALDRSPYANVPIIMLTDHSAPTQVAEAMRLGVHEFLMKPVSAAAWTCGMFCGYVLWPFVSVYLRQTTGSFQAAFLLIPVIMVIQTTIIWFYSPEHAGKELDQIAV